MTEKNDQKEVKYENKIEMIKLLQTEKLAYIENSKIYGLRILTLLTFMNAGSLILLLNFISKGVSTKTTAQLVDIFQVPMWNFILALFFILASGLLAYLNYMFNAYFSITMTYKVLNEKNDEAFLNNASFYQSRPLYNQISNTATLGIVAGVLSLVFFLFGFALAVSALFELR